MLTTPRLFPRSYQNLAVSGVFLQAQRHAHARELVSVAGAAGSECRTLLNGTLVILCAMIQGPFHSE